MVGCTPAPTVLLVSTNPYVVSLLESVKSLVPNLHFEVCCDFAQVSPLLGLEAIVLVLVDVTKVRDHGEVKELLWEVTQTERPVATVLLTEECDTTKHAEFLRAGAACCLPRDVNLRKFAHTLNALTFRARAIDQVPQGTGNADLADGNPDPSFYVLSAEMVQMMEQVRRVVPQDTTILFTG